MLKISFASSVDQKKKKKKSTEKKKETEKATKNTKSLNEYLFEKRQERKIIR